jgi:hypothetical protein
MNNDMKYFTSRNLSLGHIPPIVGSGYPFLILATHASWLRVIHFYPLCKIILRMLHLTWLFTKSKTFIFNNAATLSI